MGKTRKTHLAAVTMAVMVSGGADAGPHADKLADCMVKQTTGQDRIDLIRWTMASLAVHPDVRDLTSVSDHARKTADIQIARLVSDLVVARCRHEFEQAFRYENEAAFEQAFTVLGMVASDELMRNRDVETAMIGFTRYIDDSVFEHLE